MNNICDICGRMGHTMPYILSCNHTFCYLCIKMHKLHNNKYCPECNTEIVEDLDNIKMSDMNLSQHVWNNTKYFWMYASTYGNMWWCYDNNSNGLIEELYIEYISKQQIQDDGTSFAAQLYDNDDDDDDTPSEIKIGNSIYTIDFDTMFQINKQNPTKRRKMKRVDIGNSILFDEKMDKLKNIYNVLGMSGIKF